MKRACAYSLFGKFFSHFPFDGFVASVAVDSTAFLGSFNGLGTTAMAAIVGMIGESF